MQGKSSASFFSATCDAVKSVILVSSGISVGGEKTGKSGGGTSISGRSSGFIIISSVAVAGNSSSGIFSVTGIFSVAGFTSSFSSESFVVISVIIFVLSASAFLIKSSIYSCIFLFYIFSSIYTYAIKMTPNMIPIIPHIYNSKNFRPVIFLLYTESRMKLAAISKQIKILFLYWSTVAL